MPADIEKMTEKSRKPTLTMASLPPCINEYDDWWTEAHANGVGTVTPVDELTSGYDEKHPLGQSGKLRERDSLEQMNNNENFIENSCN